MRVDTFDKIKDERIKPLLSSGGHVDISKEELDPFIRSYIKKKFPDLEGYEISHWSFCKFGDKISVGFQVSFVG